MAGYKFLAVAGPLILSSLVIPGAVAAPFMVDCSYTTRSEVGVSEYTGIAKRNPPMVPVSEFSDGQPQAVAPATSVIPSTPNQPAQSAAVSSASSAATSVAYTPVHSAPIYAQPSTSIFTPRGTATGTAVGAPHNENTATGSQNTGTVMTPGYGGSSYSMNAAGGQMSTLLPTSIASNAGAVATSSSCEDEQEASTATPSIGASSLPATSAAPGYNPKGTGASIAKPQAPSTSTASGGPSYGKVGVSANATGGPIALSIATPSAPAATANSQEFAAFTAALDLVLWQQEAIASIILATTAPADFTPSAAVATQAAGLGGSGATDTAPPYGASSSAAGGASGPQISASTANTAGASASSNGETTSTPAAASSAIGAAYGGGASGSGFE